MRGWLYLIKNGDLYKIGITKNYNQRMRQLRPEKVIVKLYTSEFKQLERELHKRYKNVRIPQTEYFRLDPMHIREIKKRISLFYYPKSITIVIFIKAFCLLFVLFFIIILFISLTVNDLNNILFRSILLMEKISIGLSFISLFIKSDKYLCSFNELKYRTSRLVVFILFAFLFRFASRFFFFN